MLNEPLLKATLLVILDGQAALYATVMVGQAPELKYEDLVDEYKKATYQLILEAMGNGQK